MTLTPEQLSWRLRKHAMNVNRIAWRLDEFLSAVRKARAGYRDPDPETGRVKEFDGMDPGEGGRRILAAAELLIALDKAFDKGCPDLQGHGEGACPAGITCASRPICEKRAAERKALAETNDRLDRSV